MAGVAERFGAENCDRAGDDETKPTAICKPTIVRKIGEVRMRQCARTGGKVTSQRFGQKSPIYGQWSVS